MTALDAHPEQRQPTVIYTSKHVVAVFKPYGWVVVAPNADETSLLQWARQFTREHLRPVHRLDRVTAGLVLFGRTDHGQYTLEQQFKRRSIAKHYLAWAETDTSIQKQQIDRKLKKARRSYNGGKVDYAMVIPAGASGPGMVSASTYIKPIRHYQRQQLLWAQPKTGRYHQIRAHLSSLNVPIVGDAIYGAKTIWPIVDGIGLIAFGLSKLAVKDTPSALCLPTELLITDQETCPLKLPLAPQDLRPIRQSIGLPSTR